MRTKSWLILSTLGIAIPVAAAVAQGGAGMPTGPGMMMAMTHDSATMAQMRVIHELVVNNTGITRTVTNLPDGIRTTTESVDPRLAKLIKEHVVTMEARVAKADDPRLPMESPALHAIFSGYDKIRTTTDTTTNGIIVVQTSTDTAIVTALQQHAAEVTDLVKRGMTAMHEAMMKNMGMAMPAMRPPRS